MNTYKTPGVAVEELSLLPPSIAEVETAIPAFIGFTYNRGTGRTGNPSVYSNVDGFGMVVEVARITSLLEYEDIFGANPEPQVLQNIVTILDSMEGATVKKRTVSASYVPYSDVTYGAMYYQVQLYFANGGGPCYIVSVGQDSDDTISYQYYVGGLQVIEKYDEPTLLVFPDAVLLQPVPADSAVNNALNNAINAYSAKLTNYNNSFSTVLIPAQQAYDNDTSEPKSPAVVSALNAARAAYMTALNEYKQAVIDYNTAIAAGRKDQQTVGNYYKIMDKALQQCAKLKDRFVIMDCINEDTDALRLAALGTDTESLKYGAVYHPFLTTSLNLQFKTYSNVLIDHRRDTNGNGIFDIPVVDGTGNALGQITNNEIYMIAKQALDDMTLTLSPSAAVAGVYAKTDSTRGVWKAPANVSLNYVTGVTRRISDAEQESLNDDPYTGKSINAIRTFAGKGTLVWGARTLDANSSNWRYVPVRRLFTMIEESIGKAITQFILEPNDQAIWLKAQGMIENYLATLWRAGALQGAKEKDAFYVHVGLGKTMTMQDVLDGRMIVEVGLAPVRPAEFIVLKFSHLMAQR